MSEARRKPAHQWETRSHVALRDPAGPGPDFAGDPRAEAFELRFGDGRRGRVWCGLSRQRLCPVAAEDPEIYHAIGCWLVARGARRLACEDQAGRPLREGPVSPASLSSPPPARPPQRLISIAPSNAELLDALGAFEHVVAVEDSTDHPPRAQQLPRLGPDLAPDLDRIVDLAPDLVFASLTVPGMERNVTGLRARGVPTFVSAPRGLDDVVDDLARAGGSLHRREAAAEAVARFRAEMAAIAARRREPALPVYLEWWPRPMFTPGRDCYSNELIALAGGINVFGDRPGSSLEIGTEELVAANPAVCFVSWCGVDEARLDPARLVDRPGLEGLAAARAGKVFPLDERFAGRPGPRMLEAARRMAAHIDALRAEAPTPIVAPGRGC